MDFVSPKIPVAGGFEIRVPIEEDAFQLARLIEKNRDRLMKWLPWLNNSKTTSDSQTFIERTQADWVVKGVYTGLIYAENEIVGGIGFHNPTHNYMAMGYWIADKYLKQNICTRAAHALIAWAFKHYTELHLVELRASTQNKASRRVAEKLGMKFEGVLRDREWLYDHYVDHAIYSITRDEWKSRTRPKA